MNNHVEPPSNPTWVHSSCYDGPERRQTWLALTAKVAEAIAWANQFSDAQRELHEQLQAEINLIRQAIESNADTLDARLSVDTAAQMAEIREMYRDVKGTFRLLRWIVAAATAVIGLVAAIMGLR